MSIKKRLESSSVFLSIYASFFIFLVYTLMYAYRKPFSAGIYEGESFLGIDVKILFVLAQIMGYALSKFIGIRFLSSNSLKYRRFYIIGFLSFAWISLLGFALLPTPLKVLSLFLNGLPLGMIWGLVFSYIEGRRISEVLNVGLSVTFIISSGLVKTLGMFIMNQWNVSEYWMPFVVGGFCFPLLILSVYSLDIIPKPSERDIESRTKRAPMAKMEQNAFLKRFFTGILLLVIFYGSLTVFREMRDSFASDFWKEVGILNAGIFTKSETPITIVILLVMFLTVFIKNNARALNVIYIIGGVGVCIMFFSTIAYINHMLSPLAWMIFVGTGLYLGYVPFTFLIERLIASMKIVCTTLFMIYIADSFGYLGSTFVFLFKNFSSVELSWNQMFVYTAIVVSIISLFSIVGSFFYFKKYIK